MKKLLAVMLSVLLLCATLPLSVFAADGDVVLEQNFDDGNAHFERSYVENGYMVFDATTADWQNCYQYVNGIKANTNYTVTIKAKANKDAALRFKVNHDWMADTVNEKVYVTTEWQDYELNVNSGDLVFGAVVMFTSDYMAVDAAIYYIDDLKIVKAVAPSFDGFITNGDFETGDNTGWETHQSTKIDAAAAQSGNYGAHLVGNGGWGGLLDQSIATEAGKNYEITMSFKVIANGVNIQIKSAAGDNLAGGWFDKNSASEWTTKTFLVTAEDESLLINFCGAGNGVSEEVYVDNVSALELKDPSFDGYITNGDFETGKTDSWDPSWWPQNISIVEGRNGGSAMQFNGGMWQLVRQKVSVAPNTNYVVSVYAKDASDVTLLIKDGNDSSNIQLAGINAGSDWTKVSLEFNSGSWSEVYIAIMGYVDGASVVVDDFAMFEKPEASNDGYIVNGDFETGDLQPWENLWGSCPKAEVVKSGMDSNWALEIVSGRWKHVRQTNIAVEANTDYQISVWVKNAKGMSLLVKDGADTVDVVNQGIEVGDEWTLLSIEFNTGDYTSIIFSLMGNNAEEAFGTFDNVVMEKVEYACQHTYDNACDGICNLCGFIRQVPDHVFVDACDRDCDVCGLVRQAPHAYDNACDDTCNICGMRRKPAAHVYVATVTKQVTCIADGVLLHRCSVCGDTYTEVIPATGDHVYDNACDAICNGCYSVREVPDHVYSDNCDTDCNACGVKREPPHNYSGKFDEECDTCGAWREVPPRVIGDLNMDDAVNNLDMALLQRYLTSWSVDVDLVAADVDLDGLVNNLDLAILQRYINGWDVTLG